MLNSIRPVVKDLLYIKVSNAIRSYIRANRLRPGDKLPSERVLAEQLATGRNSVREALRVLENEGIIEVRTGRGAFVAQGGDQGPLYLKLFKVSFMELLEIKTVLEREVVLQAARSATPEQLAAMDEILRIVEARAATGEYDHENDQRFHRAMLAISENRTLRQMIENLMEALSAYPPLIENPGPIFTSTVPYHRQMLDAIAQRDAEAAIAAYNRIMQIDITALEPAP